MKVLGMTTLMLALASGPALAEHPIATLATLLDKAQIEDLLVDYYAHLGGAATSERSMLRMAFSM